MYGVSGDHELPRAGDPSDTVHPQAVPLAALRLVRIRCADTLRCLGILPSSDLCARIRHGIPVGHARCQATRMAGVPFSCAVPQLLSHVAISSWPTQVCLSLRQFLLRLVG